MLSLLSTGATFCTIVCLVYGAFYTASNSGVVYMTSPSKMTHSISVVYDPKKGEIVQHVSSGSRRQKFKYRLTFSDSGNLILKSESKEIIEGLIIYDGRQIDASRSMQLKKYIRKYRTVVVFFDPADGLVRETLRSHLARLVVASGILQSPHSRIEDFRSLDGAIQSILEATLQSPKCYIAIIDPVNRIIPDTPNLDLSKKTVHKRTEIMYMSPESLLGYEKLKLDYNKDEHKLIFTYMDKGCCHSPAFFLGSESFPWIKAANAGQKGVIIFDAFRRAGCCFASKNVLKQIGLGTLFMVLYSPEKLAIQPRELGKHLGQALIQANVWPTTENNPVLLAAIDMKIQDILTRYTGSKGFMVVIGGIEAENLPEESIDPENLPIDSLSMVLTKSDDCQESPCPHFPVTTEYPEIYSDERPLEQLYADNSPWSLDFNVSNSNVECDVPTLGSPVGQVSSVAPVQDCAMYEESSLPNAPILDSCEPNFDIVMANCEVTNCRVVYFHRDSKIQLISNDNSNDMAEVALNSPVQCFSSGAGKFLQFDPVEYSSMPHGSNQGSCFILLWLELGGTFELAPQDYIQLTFLSLYSTTQQISDTLSSISASNPHVPYALIKVKSC